MNLVVEGGQPWSAKKIVSFMHRKNSRAYFSRLFKNGGFRSGMEVGTAQNRFSELFLADNPTTLHEWHWWSRIPTKNSGNDYEVGIIEALV